jgi:ribonuclease J
MNGLRDELKRAVSQRYKRIDIDRFKAELKDHVTHYLFEHTGRSPIVIPVVNIIGSNKTEQRGNGGNSNDKDVKAKSPEEIAAEQQRRFQEMRARLLTQDAAD